MPLPPARAAEPGRALRRILDQRQLRILVTVGVAPFAYLDPAGEMVGFDVAIGRFLAEGLGVAASFRHVPATERLVRLQEGEADIVSTVPVSMENAREVLLTTPCCRVDITLAAPVQSALRRPTDLVDRTVGVLGGAGLEGVVREVLPAGARLLVLDTVQTLAAAVQGGRVAAVVLRRPVMALFQSANPQLELTHRFVMATRWMSVGLAFGEHDLLRTLNSLIFLAGSQGRLSALSDSLLGVPLPDLQSF